MPYLAAIPVALLVTAAACDLRWRIIPNALTAVLALGGLGAALAAGEVLWPALASAAVLAGGTGLFALGVMGGGDVKLAAALVLWLPPAAVPSFLVLTALAGGVLGLVVLAGRIARAGIAGRGLGSGAVEGLAAPAPYGVAIAAGGIAQIALSHGTGV